MLAGVARRGGSEGWNFQLALEVLSKLNNQQNQKPIGATMSQLAILLQVDVLQLQIPLNSLEDLEWVGQLVKSNDDDEHRYILLIDPAKTSLLPLAKILLLKPESYNQALYTSLAKSELTLAQALAA